MAKGTNKSKMMMAVADAVKDETKTKEPEAPATGSAMSSIAGALTSDTKPAETPAADAAKGKTKEPKGPVKIETKGQLLKALWSSRGPVYIQVEGLDFPLAIVKSVYTDKLKSGDLSEPAVHDLVARPNPNDGSDLVLRKVEEAAAE